MDTRQTLLAVGTGERTRLIHEVLRTRHGYRLESVSGPSEGPERPELLGAVTEGAPTEMAGVLVAPAAGTAGVRAVRDRAPDLPVVALHEDPGEVGATLTAGATHAVRLPTGGTTDVTGDAPATPLRNAADEVASAFDALADAPGSDTGESDTDAVPRVEGSTAAFENGASTAFDEFLPAAVDRLPDLLYVYDPDGTLLSWNARLVEVTGYDPDEIATMAPTAFIAPTDRDRIEAAVDRTVETGRTQATADLLTADGKRIPYEFTGAALETDDDRTVIAGIGRDITERRRRERVLERQADRLETLNHINAVIREVNEALVRTETREGIETAVCERLADAEPYRFVWIGEFDRGGNGVVPRSHAGEGGEYLAERAEAPSEWATAAAAMRDGEVKVVDRMTADAENAPRPAEAVEHGHHSAAGVPITYRGRTYGVLCVYAPRPDAFDEREREVLRELGETIGYAISAAERRHALLTDAVTEVELALEAPGATYVDASAAIDDTVRLDGVVKGDDGLVEFLRIPTGRVEDLRSHAAEVDLAVTPVVERDDESVVRVRLDERSLAAVVADYGGTLTGGTAESGRGSATVALPTGTSARGLIDRIDETYDGRVSLRAQREGEPVGVSGLRFREGLDESLTARQREAVETSHHAGFFEWPRVSTAEEVADLLDITAPTFHEHLRHAQRKLVAAYLKSDGTQTS
ncbi:bacterio-opsin activator domain-containing protein [Haloparvum sedimenti]|uniref:bacterio-opsin activator domain-containing protein n=1 Tax=Haloparvum sedimenti TaxID=1678448 RepID=UPI00071E9027|nr:bacterio-opsin activator domain-containing protein [Haloparvum sedimenti]